MSVHVDTKLLRDCQGWRESDLRLSTTSDTAAKMLDAGISQYIGWFDDSNLGGLEGTCSRMLEADPDFVMGKVLALGTTLLGTAKSPRLDHQLANDVALLYDSSCTRSLEKRERQHVQAVKQWCDGFMADACDTWEAILRAYPTDLLALKLAYDAYFYLGYAAQTRDSVARVLPHWSRAMPSYGYVKGMYAFGLEETNFYRAAESNALEGLAINANDAWSTHSLAHVYEMEGRQDEGIHFMSSTMNDWKPCNSLMRHNYWHLALYYIEKAEYDAAIDVFDSAIGKGLTANSMLDIVDAASLLYRLQLQGVPIGAERWNSVSEVCRPHIDDHVLAFNDAHFLFAFLGSKNDDAVKRHLRSLHDFAVSSTNGNNKVVTSEVGLALCDSLVAFDSGDFARTVELLLPLKYKLQTIGGSHAQRDIFQQLLVHAAIRCGTLEHEQLARALLNERKATKPNSSLNDRLVAQMLAAHESK